MKKQVLIIICSCVLIAGVLLGCGEKTEKAPVSRVKTVKTIIVKTDSINIERSFPGVVKSSSKTELSFDIAGRLIKLPIKEGQKIFKGQLIAQLEPDTQNYNLNSAEANFQEAQADFLRNKELYSQGVISAADYQARKKKYEMAKASLDLARKEVKNTILEAPFTGTLTKKVAENFQYVHDKETIAILQKLDDLEIEINCPENLVSYQNKANCIDFTAEFESYPDIKFPLEFKSQGKQADEVTKTYPVTFALKDFGDAVILPGMTATVTGSGTFSIKEISTPGIPANAVFADGEGNQNVWVVTEENIAVKTQVKVQELNDTQAIILSGIKNNDRIVVSGVHNILEGDEIKEYERLDLSK